MTNLYTNVYKLCEMFIFVRVTVVLHFVKILSGSRNFCELIGDSYDSTIHSQQSMAEVVNLPAVGENDFKRIIAVQRKEIMVKNERLKGVEDLLRICSEKEEKLQGWKTRAENYETALRRADARIAYLNKKLGIGPQTAFDMDVVYPGISKKDFNAVTKENVRLKEALEHIAPTKLGGNDVMIVSMRKNMKVI